MTDELSRRSGYRHDDGRNSIDSAFATDLFRLNDAALASSLQAFTAKFDDLADGSQVPTGYPGNVGTLQWDNIYVLDSVTYGESNPPNGYTNGVVSGRNVVYNGSGLDADITSGGGNFDFTSVYLTSAHRIGMSVEVMGYDDGVLKYDQTVVVDDTGPTKFTFNYTGIDTIAFHTSGGTVDPNQTGTGAQFAADNMVFAGAPGGIRGQLYNDVNGDGVREIGEQALAGRTLFLDTNHNGVYDQGEISTTTDARGIYSFANIGFGAYDVTQVLPSGWRATGGVTSQTYTLQSSAYQWIEVANRGTALSFGNSDDSSVTQQLTHPITFYGQTYTSISIGTNGYMTFGGDATVADNHAIPNTATPNAVVAPFWDDLLLGDKSHVYFYEDDLGRTVIEYKDVGFAWAKNAGMTATFEAIFRENGQILFEYNTMDEQGRTATAGIENQDGTIGSEISYDTQSLTNHSGYIFQPGAETVTSPSQHVIVDSGHTTGGVNFGSQNVGDSTGTIEGVAFHDLNGDGKVGPSDALEAGWRVWIDQNGNGVHDFGEQTTYTDANGHYAFHTLDTGTYQVIAEAPYTFEHWQFEGSGQQGAAPAHAATTPLGIAGMKAIVAQTDAALQAEQHVYQKGDFSAQHVDNQLIVRLAPGAGLNPDGSPTAATQALMHSIGATVIDSTKALGIQLWSVHGDLSLQDAASKLISSGKVLYANPNYVAHTDSVPASDAHGGVHTDVVPNDPDYPQQYGYEQIHAPQVWDYSTGSHNVVVADIDTGMDMDHPDLINNLYTNTGEIAGNGIDDDGNGYVDDVHGWDFVNDDNNPDDDDGHGTHTAGTIGADGNNGIGVTGVNWDVSLMPLKFLDASGNGSDFDAIKAIEYATMMGVKVTNNSWGGSGFDNGLYEAIAAAGQAGSLFIAAAGNSGEDNDITNESPGSYGLDNIISVAAVDDQKHLASFSEYGAQSVDLAAPGVDVLSTVPGGYGVLSGTSMATPHVAGAIALLMSIDPSLTGAELKNLVMSTVQLNGELYGKTVSGGELDLLGAINALTHTTQTVTVTGGGVSVANFGATAATTNGNDVVQGYAGAEKINGFQGNDTINGGGGDDLLIGASGNDHLTGGTGSDRFFFNDYSGKDGITDFSHAEGDLILINSKVALTFDSLTIVSDGAGGAYLRWGTSQVDVRNVAPDQLSAADFRFGGGRVSDDAFTLPYDRSPMTLALQNLVHAAPGLGLITTHLIEHQFSLDIQNHLALA